MLIYCLDTHDIAYHLEVDFNSTASTVRMLLTVVNQHTELLASDLGTTVPKDKQHAVDNVALTATVRTNYTREVLKGEYHDSSSRMLQQTHIVDEQLIYSIS